jgi:nitrite reductase/ring-hydroxylating ferredoxin subunit
VAERVKIAEKSEVPAGTGKVVTTGGRVLALFNSGGSFHAVDNTCPHRGGPLGEGHLDGTVVTCPWHGWQFDVCTGASPHNPNASVRRVPLEFLGNEIFALLE